MSIKENIERVINNQPVVFADFEMISRPRGSEKPTSIISAGLVFTKKHKRFNVKPDKQVSEKSLKNTMEFLGMSKKEVMSGISFQELYNELKMYARGGYLVVWGNYDNKTLAQQCKRTGIPHILKVYNLQEAIIGYLKKDVTLSRMLQDSSFNLPLSKIYKVLFSKEITVTHDPLQDAKVLKEIYTALTSEDRVKNRAIEIAILRLVQTHTIETLNNYVTKKIENLTKTLAYTIHGTDPEKTAKKDYIHQFNSLVEIMSELEKRVERIEASYIEEDDNYYDYAEDINLADYGPVDATGEPVGW